MALADRNLACLLITWGLWVITDWAFLITVSVMALDIGGPTAVGLVGAIRVLPAAALAPVLSGLSDRLPRPALLCAVNVIWAIIALLLAWFALAEVALPPLLIMIAVGSAASALLKPCLQALLPQLVENPGQLIVANTAYSTTEGLGTVLGPALAGVLLASSGPAVVFAILAVLYGGAAVSGRLIRTPFQPPRTSATGRRQAWLAPLQGFRVLASPGSRVVVALFMLQTGMRGLLNVFVILVATSGPGGSEARAGTLFAALGVGGVFGAILGLGLGGSRRGVGWFAAGITLWGLPVVIIGLWPQPEVAWIALGAVGFGNALADIFGYSLLNRLFPDHRAGRAWGAFHTGSAGVVAIGSVAAPLLVSAFGLSWAMVVTGAVLTLAPVLVWTRLQAVEGYASGRAADLELLRRLAIFEPMSLIGLERLARAAKESTVDSGHVVVRQGELAREFFVVADGEVSVWRDDREVRRLGPAESFGEIALLAAGTRTATVIAEQPTRLLAVDSDAFIGAVTGHRPTDDLARTTVDDLLAADSERAHHRPPPEAR